MAIQKSIELPTGLVLNEAYHRLVSVVLDYANKNFQLKVLTYVNEQARLDNKMPIKTAYHNGNTQLFDQWFSINILDEINKNPFQQGYEYLKILQDYESGVDV